MADYIDFIFELVVGYIGGDQIKHHNPNITFIGVPNVEHTFSNRFDIHKRSIKEDSENNNKG